MISALTDIGIVKDTNQDSYGVKLLDTRLGKIVVAILCDGMGGYSKGEVASATVVDAFSKWTLNRLPELCKMGISDSVIRQEWDNVIQNCNEKIKEYGMTNGINLGTTVVVMMITNTRYYIANVGDSRIYEISDKVEILTQDQTVVAQEVLIGNITEEQAKIDPRRSILLQCVGASDVVVPDITTGRTKQNAVYMLCSDGFRHEISNEEIYQYLNPDTMTNEIQMENNMDNLIDINKQRCERDNITVISIRTY